MASSSLLNNLKVNKLSVNSLQANSILSQSVLTKSTPVNGKKFKIVFPSEGPGSSKKQLVMQFHENSTCSVMFEYLIVSSADAAKRIISWFNSSIISRTNTIRL